MRLWRRVGALALLCALAVGGTMAVAATDAPNASDAGRLASIAGAAREEIAAHHIPGAVIVVGRGDDVVYRRAFGWRADGPMPEPMTADAMFDLASVTKVVATTTAVMQLVERGQVTLDSPVAQYWPAFAAHGKRDITVRDLLTHYSGLRPDLDLRRPWLGYGAAVRQLAAETPVAPAGRRYIYSDENFAALGEIVRRVSGLPFDVYCARRIFQPLGMTHTRFRPMDDADAAIAPTSSARGASRATVNDPMAARMGGVAGHAGVFSTADDLTRFVRMLLDGGELDGLRILRRASIDLMTTPQSPASGGRRRGLGWDLAQAHVAADEERYPAGSYGHTGYTGTMIWVDPASRVFAIVLTNRTYRGSAGDAQPLRDAVLRALFAPPALAAATSVPASAPPSGQTAATHR